MDLRAVFDGVRTILLVDWPRPEVPAILHRAGFDVVGHEPDSYKRYEAVEDGDGFALVGGGVLRSTDVSELPAGIGILCTARPPEEQVEIVAMAVDAGARTFWVERGIEASDEARVAAEAAGLTFVRDVGIADAVRELGISAPRD